MTDPVTLTTEGCGAGILHGGGREPEQHSPRPFLHPVPTPSGLPVTDYRPADHPWHWGLSIAVSNIAVAGQAHPVNLWGGPTYSDGQGYVQLPNNGSQRVRSTVRVGGGVVQQIDWRAADGSSFLTEERTWHAESVTAAGSEWILTSVRSRWANTSGGPLAFGSPTTAGRPDAGYGGFFLRLPASFDGAAIIAGPAGGAGSIPEAEAMGGRHPWLGLRSGTASVLMVPAADNPGSPTPWFVRSTGTPMLCAAPFFHQEVHLGTGDILDWSWSLLTADGPVPDTGFAAAAQQAEVAGGAAGAVRP
ncbi:DUF6807 family protein [Arthrobacter sedimenti]|uniref:DUF6807 family protein n=1 Tax=Arthrobacter sedimenti TaxID=2694931 RepID=UPI000B353A37|nr:DUF6807 family protein [Arthrobacter sedimenti]OUM39991.1 hypothetical protein B8W73_16405 [Arthrobacter agilis]